MNSKQMLGLVFLSLGVVLLIFSFHSRGIIEKRQRVEVLTHSPISPTERLPDSVEVNSSSAREVWVLLGGIVLVVIGGGIAICYRK